MKLRRTSYCAAVVAVIRYGSRRWHGGTPRARVLELIAIGAIAGVAIAIRNRRK
jgi:hypothetical protein